jgi:hypothetical protein
MFEIHLGTVQGLILGPILYAIFFALLFDLEMFLAFADDMFIPRIEQSLTKFIDDMEKSLEVITKWPKQSGLVVNQSKTEICLFHTLGKTDQLP